MDIKSVASRVAAVSVEAARRKRQKRSKPAKKRPATTKRRSLDSTPDDMLRSETEYSCRVELSITASFEGRTDKHKLLKKVKLELLNAIKSGITTVARETNLASTGVSVQPLKMEIDVNDMSMVEED